jgi:hypothetical protein
MGNRRYDQYRKIGRDVIQGGETPADKKARKEQESKEALAGLAVVAVSSVIIPGIGWFVRLCTGKKGGKA